jgi:hypothetical protein
MSLPYFLGRDIFRAFHVPYLCFTQRYDRMVFLLCHGFMRELTTMVKQYHPEFSINRPFLKACHEGNMKMVKYLISIGVTVLNEGLACAHSNGHVKIVQLLLEKGANNWEWSLFCAYFGINTKITDLLIKTADINWNCGLEHACRDGRIELVKFMIENGATDLINDLSNFHNACTYGHVEIVKFMIENGANNWQHGLFHGCYGRNIEIVELMIEKGANPLYCYNCYGEYHRHRGGGFALMFNFISCDIRKLDGAT